MFVRLGQGFLLHTIFKNGEDPGHEFTKVQWTPTKHQQLLPRTVGIPRYSRRSVC